MSTPVYANDFQIWAHKECFCIQFKFKLSGKEDLVATVLISPSNFQELAELTAEISESYKESRVVQEDENYKGIEFG